MAIKHTYRYSVTGPGAFPIDMLRYDAAHPASEGDAGFIELTHGRHAALTSATVELIGLRPPTAGRWQSFGWRIVDWSKREAV
jgi:hypothetical protein